MATQALKSDSLEAMLSQDYGIDLRGYLSIEKLNSPLGNLTRDQVSLLVQQSHEAVNVIVLDYDVCFDLYDTELGHDDASIERFMEADKTILSYAKSESLETEIVMSRARAINAGLYFKIPPVKLYQDAMILTSAMHLCHMRQPFEETLGLLVQTEAVRNLFDEMTRPPKREDLEEGIHDRMSERIFNRLIQEHALLERTYKESMGSFYDDIARKNIPIRHIADAVLNARDGRAYSGVNGKERPLLFPSGPGTFCSYLPLSRKNQPI
jgi:hypothetical protein